jgi:pentose-5-phosphate-3-epimerase
MDQVLLEANDPATTPERLRRLASHRDARVRMAVARNPNTPGDALFRLVVRHADAVLSNPVMDLLVLENPNILAEMPDYARTGLLSHPNAPESFLEWAEKWQSGVLDVLSNPATPKPLLERLAQSDDESVSGLAKTHVNLAGEFIGDAVSAATTAMAGAQFNRDGEAIKELFAVNAVPGWLLETLAADSETEIRQLVACHPDTPAHVLERLLGDDEEEVRRQAVVHARTPRTAVQNHARAEAMDANLQPEVLERLASSSAWGRKLAARHSNTPLCMITGFATDEDWRVREAAAANPGLPEEVLLDLSRDNDRDVRSAIALNPSTPQTILEQLLFDGDERVRQTATNHPNAPSALIEQLERANNGDPALTQDDLEALAAKGDWGRQLAATHPHTNKERLERFSTDESWRIRQAVARNPNASEAVLHALSQDSDADVRSGVACNPATPERILEHLSLDQHHEVRKSVVQRPGTPSEILGRLAADDHWTVRQAVAGHTNTPTIGLIALSQDNDRDVRQAVADRDHLPANVILALFGTFDSENPDALEHAYQQVRTGQPDAPLDWIDRFAAIGGSARLMAARHPRCSAVTLHTLCQDDDWRVRQAVAKNPNTPVEVLEYLLEDMDADVRAAVAAHPNSDVRMLERLCTDAHVGVKQAILSRQDVPLLALERLCGDDEDEIRTQAQAHPRVPAHVLEAYQQLEAHSTELAPELLERLALAGGWSRKLVACHPGAPPALLAQLATDEFWTVRQAVASNPATSPGVLESLAADADLDVRKAVASNPSTPQAALQVLLEDVDATVKRAALGHLNLDRGLRKLRCQAVIARCARSRESLNRMVGLSHPETPVSELMKQRNLRSPIWLERLALVMNPNLPQAGLARLAGDAHQLVRAVARSRLEGQA